MHALLSNDVRRTERLKLSSILRHGNSVFPPRTRAKFQTTVAFLGHRLPPAPPTLLSLDGCHCQSRPRPAEKIRRIHPSPPLGTFHLVVMFSFGTIFVWHVMFDRAHLVLLFSPLLSCSHLAMSLFSARSPAFHACVLRRLRCCHLHRLCFLPPTSIIRIPDLTCVLRGGWLVFLVCICLWWQQKQNSALPSI